MNDYSGGRIAPAPSENVKERPERVTPGYRGLFLAPDIEPADDDGDDDDM